ncbi:Radiation-sensitive protein 28 [Nakaseomyces bracarensis]|uniref:Radiation-sensitive protein 28 n=1 Tax=Nakaseomyces bracarensis TaxID=273131 RepID=A0ABR4NY07_9SACH
MNKLAFERLFENHASTINDSITNDSLRVYSHAPNRHSTATSAGVSALKCDTTIGNLLLSGSYDGSVALWDLDGKLAHNGLVNRRSQYVTRKLNDDNTTKLEDARYVKGKRHREDDKDVKFYHSFETRSYKYKMYRKSNHGTAMAQPTPLNTTARNEAHNFGVTSLCWYGPDNGIFFTGSNDNFVKVWDTATFESVKSYNLGYRVNGIDNNKATQTQVAVVTDDYYPRIIDMKMASSDQSLQLGSKSPMRDPVLCCQFHPRNGYILATGDAAGSCKIWDIRMVGAPLFDLVPCGSAAASGRAHLKSCNGLTWNQDGNELVTIGTDGRIRLWTPFQLNLETIEPESVPETEVNAQVGEGGEDEALNLTNNGCRTLGGSTIDPLRNKEQNKYRTSQRLEWFDKYLLVSTDYGEIQIFETDSGKYLDKFHYDYENDLQHTKSKLVKTIKRNKKLFGGMCLQRSLNNGIGLRLFLGTNDGYIVEMT